VQSVRNALQDARNTLYAQVPVRLSKDLDIGALSEALSAFDGVYDYTYGMLPQTGEMCALVNITYTPGARMAWAYLTGDRSFLSDNEKNALSLAAALIQSDDFVSASELARERMIHDFIASITEYSHREPEQGELNDFQTALGVLLSGSGNCMGYSDTFLMLSRMAGFDVYTVHGEAHNGKSLESHAWNVIRIDDDWVAVDVTWDDVDIEPFVCTYVYYNVGADMLSGSHIWDNDIMPVMMIQSMSGSYAYVSGEYTDLYYICSESDFCDLLMRELPLLQENDVISVFCDGFRLSEDGLRSYLTLADPYRSWTFIESNLGTGQYWTFSPLK